MRRHAAFSVLLATTCAASCAQEPPAEVEVVSVKSLGRMEQPSAIAGRDGGASGRFRGRSVWVYGDSVATARGTYPTTWRNNTMSWTGDLDAADGVTDFIQPEDTLGAAREFFPRTMAEEAFNAAHVDLGDGMCAEPCGARYAIWGSGPVEDEARDRALLVYGKVYAKPGAFNFHIIGTSIAIWNDFDTGPVRPEVDAGLEDPTLLFDASEGEFGIPAIADGQLYLFSCSGGRHDSRACRLGRAPLADVLQRKAWEFRTRTGWSKDVAHASGLFEGSPNMTVHWSEHVARWLAVYITFGKIVVRTAAQIEGPWSSERTIYEPREHGAMHALAHAEYQEGGGEVEYISYLADDFRLLRVHLDPR